MAALTWPPASSGSEGTAMLREGEEPSPACSCSSTGAPRRVTFTDDGKEVVPSASSLRVSCWARWPRSRAPALSDSDHAGARDRARAGGIGLLGAAGRAPADLGRRASDRDPPAAAGRSPAQGVLGVEHAEPGSSRRLVELSETHGTESEDGVTRSRSTISQKEELCRLDWRLARGGDQVAAYTARSRLGSRPGPSRGSRVSDLESAAAVRTLTS